MHVLYREEPGPLDNYISFLVDVGWTTEWMAGPDSAHVLRMHSSMSEAIVGYLLRSAHVLMVAYGAHAAHDVKFAVAKHAIHNTRHATRDT